MTLTLRRCYPFPTAPRPIVVIGAGGIVNDAHLPAYRKAGFPVTGVFDLDAGKARNVAQRWEIPTVFDSLAQATSVADCVFDVAAPPVAHADIVAELPHGASVLLQNPWGRTWGLRPGFAPPAAHGASPRPSISNSVSHP
jgi:predicted dehydrogenase